jgi:hypothetical protein
LLAVVVVAQALAQLLKVVAVVLVAYAQAKVSCWLKALHTQSQSVLVALTMPMVLTQYFPQSPQQVAVRVVVMEQRLEARVGLVVAPAEQQLRGLMETRLAHHLHKETMVALVWALHTMRLLVAVVLALLVEQR